MSAAPFAATTQGRVRIDEIVVAHHPHPLSEAPDAPWVIPVTVKGCRDRQQVGQFPNGTAAWTWLDANLPLVPPTSDASPGVP